MIVLMVRRGCLRPHLDIATFVGVEGEAQVQTGRKTSRENIGPLIGCCTRSLAIVLYTKVDPTPGCNAEGIVSVRLGDYAVEEGTIAADIEAIEVAVDRRVLPSALDLECPGDGAVFPLPCMEGKGLQTTSNREVRVATGRGP